MQPVHRESYANWQTADGIKLPAAVRSSRDDDVFKVDFVKGMCVCVESTVRRVWRDTHKCVCLVVLRVPCVGATLCIIALCIWLHSN